MDENILMRNLYKHSIEKIEETYRELYSDPAWKENTDKYSKAIINFYQKLNKNQKEDFYVILKQINIDTISTAFGILEGSSSSDIDIELKLIDEEENTYEYLQDSFLAVAEENEK